MSASISFFLTSMPDPWAYWIIFIWNIYHKFLCICIILSIWWNLPSSFTGINIDVITSLLPLKWQPWLIWWHLGLPLLTGPTGAWTMSPRPLRMGHGLPARARLSPESSPEHPLCTLLKASRWLVLLLAVSQERMIPSPWTGERWLGSSGEAPGWPETPSRKEFCTVGWSWHSEDSQVLSLEGLGLGILWTLKMAGLST